MPHLEGFPDPGLHRVVSPVPHPACLSHSSPLSQFDFLFSKQRKTLQVLQEIIFHPEGKNK